MNRDPRWENVEAHVLVIPEVWPNDISMAHNGAAVGKLEFYIKVQTDRWLVWGKQIVDPEVLADAQFDMYSWILNEMVRYVDSKLEELEKS